MERNRSLRGSTERTTTARTNLPHIDGVEHRFVDLPGLRMHLAEVGEGDPVLLLHGAPVHWYGWHKMIPGLAAHRRVICPDLRGSGWTEAPRAGYTRDQMTADVVALLDALELDKVTLVSHDMNAITGYALCWDHPERVVRHVAVGVPPLFVKLPTKVLPEFRHLWHQEALAVPGLGAALTGRGRQRVIRHMLNYPPPQQPWTPQEREIFLAPLREPARARAMSAMCRHMVLPEVGRLLSGHYRTRRLTTPTLVAAAAGDPLFPPELIREMLADTDAYADHVEVATVGGAEHHQPAEAPERLVELILGFRATTQA